MPNKFWILLDQMIMHIQIQIYPIQVHPKQVNSNWTQSTTTSTRRWRAGGRMPGGINHRGKIGTITTTIPLITYINLIFSFACAKSTVSKDYLKVALVPSNTITKLQKISLQTHKVNAIINYYQFYYIILKLMQLFTIVYLPYI